MTGAELRDVLLVRAAEECRPPGHPGAVPPERLVEAQHAAGSLDDVDRWLARRAAWLLAGPLADLRPLRAMTGAVRGGLGLLFGVTVVAGLASNYLGPSNKIHVLFNPIALLIAWNLGAYLAGVVGRIVWMAGKPPRIQIGDVPPRPADAAAPGAVSESPGLLARLVFYRLVPAAWLRFHRTVLAGAEQAADLGHVARRFWQHWVATAGRVLALLARRAMHVGAIGLALGAVAGMYARGLVFEYDVIWRSTFITDPDGFLGLLRAALGPAAWVLGRDLPSAADAAQLLTAEGAPAAPWIHLYAVSALLFVVLPRLALAGWATARARWVERRVSLHPDDPYVASLLERAKRYKIEQVRDEIDDDVRVAARELADALAAFVCTELYDASLAPAIRAFRETGGAIADLEATLAERCDAFGPALAAEVPRARRAFEEQITGRIVRRLGASPSTSAIRRAELGDKLDAVSGDASHDLGDSLGHGLADTVSAAVAAALALVAANVSGGFGEAIGIAVLAGLLESGPVGWIVGAVAGLVAAGAGWWLGRDAITRGVKQISLPAMVTRTVLWTSRLEGIIATGRERCEARVRELVEAELATLTTDVAEEIWKRITPLLGERLRPDAPAPEADLAPRAPTVDR